eukprot:6702165-Prymnesium_polylepis.1
MALGPTTTATAKEPERLPAKDLAPAPEAPAPEISWSEATPIHPLHTAPQPALPSAPPPAMPSRARLGRAGPRVAAGRQAKLACNLPRERPLDRHRQAL